MNMEMGSLHGFQLLDFSHYNKATTASLSQQQILSTLSGIPLSNREEITPNVEASFESNTINTRPNNNGARKFECNVCQKSFKQLAHLNTHALLHEGKRPHKCSYCDQTFSQLTHLKRHLVTHRSGDDNRSSSTYSCDMCPRRFAFPSDLAAHRNKHLNRNQRKSGNRSQTQRAASSLLSSSGSLGSSYKCNMCDRAFQYPSQLREHMYVHTHIRRFPCGECGRRFMKEHHLKVHQQSTHQCLRPHACHVCHKTFSIKANLERHLFVHSVHKTFECPVCSKRFAQPQTLKMHLVSHNDVKPFQCSICGKGLARAHNLRAHMAIHRQNKPYSCNQCSATFTLKGNLQRHNKEKHSFDMEQSSQQQMISVDEEASQSQGTAFERSQSPEGQQDYQTENDGRQSEDSLESEIDPVFDEPVGTMSSSQTNQSVGALQGAQQQTNQQPLFQPYANCTAQQQTPVAPSELFHHPLPVFSQHMAQLPVPVPHPFYANATASDLSAIGHNPLQLLHEAPPPSVMMQHANPVDLGARLQAIHAALDEIAQQSVGAVGVPNEKITAIHLAVDELIPLTTNSGHPPHLSHHLQGTSHNQMLDLRCGSSQLDHL